MAATDSRTERKGKILALPKVELHRHLEGSLRLSTLAELVTLESLELPAETALLQRRVQIHPGDPLTVDNFLSKFDALRMFYRSPEIIRRVTREAIADAAAEGIRYLELRFTPAALANVRQFSLADVTDWVIDAGEQAAQDQALQLGLIISINRHESVTLAEKVAQIAVDRLDKGIVGLDLAGNEVEFDAEPFRSIFRDAAQAGLGITIHAGEWSGAATVRHALENMGAQRIGHGVRVIEDEAVTALARERRTVFEVCLTSNLQSGVVGNLIQHPFLAMLNAGLQVTLNTDDPGISDISLVDEYEAAIFELGLSMESLKGLVLAAAQASFLPDRKKRELENALQFELGLHT